MNLPVGFDQALAPLLPHLWPVALCAARLLPICLLCPLLGGSVAPVPVRLSLALLLALFLHLGCGVGLGKEGLGSGQLAVALALQLVAGVGIGYVAALPFHAARVGGRLLDTFRGATSETRLIEDGDGDAATAGLLHPLLVALLCAGPGHALFLGAVVRGFATLPLSGSIATGDLVERCAAGALSMVATGLAIGAPVAALGLLVDVGLGLAARTAPQLRLTDSAPPLKLALGAALILLTLGQASARLLATSAGSVQTVRALQDPAAR